MKIRFSRPRPAPIRIVGGPRRRFSRTAVTLCLISGLACANGGANPDDDVAGDPVRRDARIAELRQSIDRDHATLQALISQPRGDNTEDTDDRDDIDLYHHSEIRAIAKRMPEQERALERLEAARDASASAK